MIAINDLPKNQTIEAKDTKNIHGGAAPALLWLAVTAVNYLMDDAQ